MFKKSIYLFALLLSASALAEEQTRIVQKNCALVSDPRCGWFFYQDDSVVREPIAPPPAAAPPVTPPKPAPVTKKPITVKWLREMIPKLHEEAIDNPTPENVAAYAYAVKLMGMRAHAYTKAHVELIETDPFLDENNRFPMGNGKQIGDLRLAYAKEKVIKHIAKNVGALFVFFDSRCKFCTQQIGIVNRMAKTHGFIVKYVSVDGKGLNGATGWMPDVNGWAKKLELTVFPTTVFVAPPSDFMIISQGMMDDSTMTKKIITAASRNKYISPEMIAEVTPEENGMLSVEDMQDGAFDDPVKFVEYFKKKLKGRL